MEGRESEPVFESLNLNPRILVNEILNTVENLLDDAFDFHHQDASILLNANDTGRSQQLTEDVDQIRSIIQSNVGRRLGVWQEYCLRHCFALPQGFSLPQNESQNGSLTCQDVLCDPELDAQLGSLRDRLILVGKESAEINCELQALERQSALSDHCAALVNELLQLYEQNSANDLLQEMTKTASELRAKIEKLRMRRIKGRDCIRTKRICDPNIDLSTLNHGKGLSDAKFEDLQEFLADLKKM